VPPPCLSVAPVYVLFAGRREEAMSAARRAAKRARRPPSPTHRHTTTGGRLSPPPSAIDSCPPSGWPLSTSANGEPCTSVPRQQSSVNRNARRPDSVGANRFPGVMLTLEVVEEAVDCRRRLAWSSVARGVVAAAVVYVCSPASVKNVFSAAAALPVKVRRRRCPWPATVTPPPVFRIHRAIGSYSVTVRLPRIPIGN